MLFINSRKKGKVFKNSMRVPAQKNVVHVSDGW